MSKKKTKEIYDEALLGTFETMENIEHQYNHPESRLSEESELIVDYINKQPTFNRKVIYLYFEYQSYRLVSYETNFSKDTIAKIINKLRKDIKKGKHLPNK